MAQKQVKPGSLKTREQKIAYEQSQPKKPMPSNLIGNRKWDGGRKTTKGK